MAFFYRFGIFNPEALRKWSIYMRVYLIDTIFIKSYRKYRKYVLPNLLWNIQLREGKNNNTKIHIAWFSDDVTVAGAVLNGWEHRCCHSTQHFLDDTDSTVRGARLESKIWKQNTEIQKRSKRFGCTRATRTHAQHGLAPSLFVFFLYWLLI